MSASQNKKPTGSDGKKVQPSQSDESIASSENISSKKPLITINFSEIASLDFPLKVFGVIISVAVFLIGLAVAIISVDAAANWDVNRILIVGQTVLLGIIAFSGIPFAWAATEKGEKRKKLQDIGRLFFLAGLFLLIGISVAGTAKFFSETKTYLETQTVLYIAFVSFVFATCSAVCFARAVADSYYLAILSRKKVQENGA